MTEKPTPTTIEETWEDRFDREFPSPDGRDFVGVERISSLKSFIRTTITKERKIAMEEALGVIDEVFKEGHGGGNWRRLVIQAKERIKERFGG